MAILTRSLTVLAVVGLLVSLAIFFRYDIQATGSFVVRLDRLTGKVEWCLPNRQCSEYITR